MKLLLDTHIILWALDDNPRLPLEARRFIMDEKMIFITARHRSGRQRLNICQGLIRFGLGARSCLNYAGKWDIGCCRLRTGM